MKRRNFLQMATSAAGLMAVGSASAIGSGLFLSDPDLAELAKHKIVRSEMRELNFHWPRFVGKNGRIDFHGQHKKATVLLLHTDQGAMGWGMSGRQAEQLLPALTGKKVSELLIPGKGVIEGLNRTVDFALHDLAGVILNKPVFQLYGSEGPTETAVYSGMIYLDELNPENETKGVDAILENCEWDYNYGYRQLKVKIGRSGRWYEHEAGMKKDIEVVRLIHNAFKNRDIDILVDSNDMYTLEDTLRFLDGIGDIPIFWVEEPFRETLEAGRKLKRWMMENGFAKTLYVDGEANPDYDVCMQLGKEKVMDAFLDDTYSLGFTEWIRLMPRLKEMGMLASPHAWGDRLKTNYTAHLSAALGNIVTIEGVTCLSEEIDYGNYPIVNGKLRVSGAPGFGMKIIG